MGIPALKLVPHKPKYEVLKSPQGNYGITRTRDGAVCAADTASFAVEILACLKACDAADDSINRDLRELSHN